MKLSTIVPLLLFGASLYWRKVLIKASNVITVDINLTSGSQHGSHLQRKETWLRQYHELELSLIVVIDYLNGTTYVLVKPEKHLVPSTSPCLAECMNVLEYCTSTRLLSAAVRVVRHVGLRTVGCSQIEKHVLCGIIYAEQA